MTPEQRQDFSHALGQTLEFFGKDLDKKQFAFWMQAMGQYPVGKIKQALVEYVSVGRYAPKPAQIIEILGELREQERAALPPPVQPLTTRCPKEISDAWRWFVGMHTKLDLGELTDRTPVAADVEEKYLRIVNREAHRLNMPDAIPEEFRLREVWEECAF